MKVIKILILLCIFHFFYFSNAIASEPLPIFVSIAPQKYFVEKIGGEHVAVSVMVEPGASPANYEPKPKQMVALSKTRIYYAIGVPFETTWLKKILSANPEMLLVYTQEGIEKIPMKTEHHHTEAHHKKEDQGIKDPHIWLSPQLVMIQAKNILNALVTADPTHREVYEANYQKFIKEATDLDTELKGIFAEKKGLQFMVFHPSWGYFADAYGLEQIPVEIEGKEPKPAELQKLIQHAKEKGIRVIFVQPQFSIKSATVIANAIGGHFAFADPLALNWADNLRQVGEAFKSALK